MVNSIAATFSVAKSGIHIGVDLSQIQLWEFYKTINRNEIPKRKVKNLKMNFVVEIRHCLIVTLITVLGGQTVAAQTKDGKAETIEKSFNRKTTISRWVNASPMEVWRVLTEAENYPNWNSNIISIAGNIALDQKIKLRTTLDSSRTFTLKIKEFQPNALLQWCNSKGIRTFVLKEKKGGTSITMTEKIGGLMYPLYAKYLPSFNDSFEIFMSDLKKIVETK